MLPAVDSEGWQTEKKRLGGFRPRRRWRSSERPDVTSHIYPLEGLALCLRTTGGFPNWIHTLNNRHISRTDGEFGRQTYNPLEGKLMIFPFNNEVFRGCPRWQIQVLHGAWGSRQIHWYKYLLYENAVQSILMFKVCHPHFLMRLHHGEANWCHKS